MALILDTYSKYSRVSHTESESRGIKHYISTFMLIMMLGEGVKGTGEGRKGKGETGEKGERGKEGEREEKREVEGRGIPETKGWRMEWEERGRRRQEKGNLGREDEEDEWEMGVGRED